MKNVENILFANFKASRSDNEVILLIPISSRIPQILFGRNIGEHFQSRHHKSLTGFSVQPNLKTPVPCGCSMR